MAQFKIDGNPATTLGDLPKAGEKAPGFLLTKTDLSDIRLKDFAGKKLVLNIFPSIDTPVCSASVRRFNSEISKCTNTMLVCVSLDLPFAHSRFCETEGLKNVISVSELRSRKFGDDYGVRIQTGPLAGLLARAVVVIDETGMVLYSKLVAELKSEPDYGAALKALNSNAQDENICMKTFTAEHSRLDDDNDPCDDGRSG